MSSRMRKFYEGPALQRLSKASKSILFQQLRALALAHQSRAQQLRSSALARQSRARQCVHFRAFKFQRRAPSKRLLSSLSCGSWGKPVIPNRYSICCQVCHWGWKCSEHLKEFGEYHSIEICKYYQELNRIKKVALEYGDENDGESIEFITKYSLESSDEFPSTCDQYRTLEFDEELSEDLWKLNTEKVSDYLTVASSLRRLGLDNQESLTVHIIGCDYTDCMPSDKWEELLHLLHQVENLELVFIGPELKNIIQSDEDFLEFSMKTSSPDVSLPNGVRVFQFYRDTYESFVESSDYNTPSACFVFGSDFPQTRDGNQLLKRS